MVIPAGSPATGEVTDVRRKGMWGKSGRITARVLNVRVGDRLIRLTGTFDDKGVLGPPELSLRSRSSPSPGSS